MPLLIFVAWLLLMIISSAISQKCIKHNKTEQLCPTHSFCNDRQYCQCQKQYVYNCKIKGQLIQQKQKLFQLNYNKQKLFLIYPSDDSVVYSYRFNFCQADIDSSLNYHLSLYSDDGTSNKIDESKRIGKAKLQQVRQCWSVLSPFLKFDRQENGQIQTLILVVKINGTNLIKGIEKRIQKEEKGYKIKVSVDEIQLFDLETIWIILFSMVGITFLSLIGGIIYCAWFLKKKNKKNSIKHFKKYMPIQKLNKQNINQITPNDRICSICLIEFEINDKIRKTICNHCFHALCLDQWCKTKISCPICRQSFNQNQLKAYHILNKQTDQCLSQSLKSENQQHKINYELEQSQIQTYMQQQKQKRQVKSALLS